MKYLVTPEFSKKLGAMARIITRISQTSYDDFSSGELLGWVQSLGENIYALKAGDVRILATTVSSEEDTSLLMLDIIEYKTDSGSGKFYTAKDPRTNSSLNPQYNSRLNPAFNSLLNPQFNSSINPQFNSMINPRFNSSLNPKLNAAINPKFNSSINPNFNSMINPRHNSAINPRFNTAYGGPFLYDLNLSQKGFIVNANANIILIFDMSGGLYAFGVANQAGGYTLFDTNNEWLGQLVAAENGVFLRFDLKNQHTGMVV